MEFTIKRDDLYGELTTLKKYLSKLVPALSNFLFEVDDQKQTVKVTSCDSHNILDVSIPAKVTTGGKTIMASSILFGALKNFPSEDVKFKTDPSGQLFLTCKKKKVRVPTSDAQSYIKLPEYQADETLKMKSEELIAIVKGTSFAKLKNPGSATDYKFEGVNVKINKGQATFLCSDRARVALGRFKFNSTLDIEFTLSGKSLEDFVNGLDDGEDVEIKWDNAKQKCFIDAGNKTLYPSLYAEKYPDVGKYIPNPQTNIVVKRQELINSLEIATLVHEHIDLKAEGQELKLSNQGAGTGAFTEALNATISNDNQVSLRTSYFLEGLKAMPGDEVELMIEDARKPVIVRPKQKSDYAYLLIPVV